MKNKYVSPVMEICAFEEDIIMTSNLLSQWIAEDHSNSIAVELNDTELYMAYDE